jgi:hypothetical protein
MVRIVRQGKEIARYWDLWGEIQMRKIRLLAAIALMLARVGVWATSTTQARIDLPAGAQINPLEITMGAKHLPLPIMTITPWCSIERPRPVGA